MPEQVRQGNKGQGFEVAGKYAGLLMQGGETESGKIVWIFFDIPHIVFRILSIADIVRKSLV